eukprot:5870109-Pyramimonas_sp.AAC.1
MCADTLKAGGLQGRSELVWPDAPPYELKLDRVSLVALLLIPYIIHLTHFSARRVSSSQTIYYSLRQWHSSVAVTCFWPIGARSNQRFVS